MKRAWLTHSTLNVCTGGNYDVVTKTVTPGFQHTGTWHNYFTGESIEVSNASGHSIEVEPGGYYVFTDIKLERPMVNLTLKVVWKETGNGVNNALVQLEGMGSRITGSDGLAEFVPFSNNNYTFNLSISGQNDTTGSITVTEEDLIYTIEISGWNDILENPNASISVYPNPAHNYITIVTDDDYTLALADLNGRIIIERNIINGNNRLNLDSMKPGIYILKFNNGIRRSYKKIVIY